MESAPSSPPVRLPRGFSHVETWVLDLDNTLYPHHLNLWQQVDERIRDYIAKFLGIGREDKDKMHAYYDSIKLGDQMEHGDQQGKSTDELNQQMNELTEKLGPEYAALMAEYQNMDLTSREGLETGAIIQQTVDKLIALCGPRARRSGRD